MKDEKLIKNETIADAEIIMAVSFSNKERENIIPYLRNYKSDYQKGREIKIQNNTKPPLYFNPLTKSIPTIKRLQKNQYSKIDNILVPENKEELAFFSILQLAFLLQKQEITSVELTKLYLNRLKRFDPELQCVITFTKELAIEQAELADEEIYKGKYRSLLHGIPYGIKDLFSYPGYPTTWGAEPFRNQILNQKATVIAKLEDAGAVMIAKLSTGRLASDHRWFGGETKSPWNIENHAGGSSAGSASATAAGLIGFSIGTETWGSIIQPCHQCGTTGLRPTYGRVSSYGVMSLSWSLDKVGPICRTVEDCAIVFDAIYGPDGKDKSIIDIPFHWNVNQELNEIRIGYTKDLFEMEYQNKEFDLKTLDILKNLGVNLTPVKLPILSSHTIDIITACDMSTFFEELVLNKIDVEPWANSLKAARFIPAIEYIKAQRYRWFLMEEMQKLFDLVNIIITPTIDYTNIFWKTSSNYLSNLTGHPAVVVPNGFKKNGMPSSVTFIGDLYKEEEVLRVAKLFQDNTDFHLMKPELTNLQ
ncbi:MAG: amidase [Candidatus Hodarchaeota archaeon]